ncbi:hypothetical protein LB524_00155 [Mesorhizobium sp. ESP6-5]|uniref:hypothetical protein n=1 Tax=Mesorhizobium sp. ESP6-5 TaxID=2876623 RepID=UPI001CCE5195|nr:hypothetical protein [Mesorhizobium sp. ESP6-5]MBZ9753686.1 hypothetical protein [Mesorhizobium sp. ESP6-5]
MAENIRQGTSSDFRPVGITPTIRVVETDREWIIQAVEMKRTRRHGIQPKGEWVDRAYITSRTMLNGELKRLVGNGAMKAGLRGHVGQDVLDWLNRLPERHPCRATNRPTQGHRAEPSVLDVLEAMGSDHIHTSHELRDDLPLIIKHGPLKYRDHWNARFDI